MPRTLALRALCVVVLFIALLATFVTGIGGGGGVRAAGAAGPIVDAEIGQVPSQIYVVVEAGDDIRQCSGSLVAPTAVLTAAQCVDGVSPAAVAVAGGFIDIENYQGEGAQIALADGIEVHPLYDGGSPGDVAIITVAEPFEISDTLQPIELASATILSNARTGIVSGWGLTSDDDEATNRRLQTAEVDMVPTPVCALDHLDLMPEFEFCAENVVDTECSSTNGSPLVIRDGTRSVLAGVASYGEDCTAPRVFTELPSFQGWIRFTAGLTDEVPAILQDDADAADDAAATDDEASETSTFTEATPVPDDADATTDDAAATDDADAEDTAAEAVEEAEEDDSAFVESTPTPVPAAAEDANDTDDSAAESATEAAADEAADELPVTGPTTQLTMTQWALIIAITGILVLSSPQMYRARRTTRIVDLLEQVPLDEREARTSRPWR